MKAQPHDIVDLIDTASSGSPRNSVGFMLWRITHRYQRDVDRALKTQQLTHLQFVTLTLAAWLGRDGEPVNQAQLGRFGSIHPMQVSTVVKALEEKGLIVREPAAVGPAKAIGMTLQGVAALRAALPLVKQVQRDTFGDAGRTGGELFDALAQIDLEGD
ncbi:MarR family winged helix-turn-helix transcriptional regulator [Sphingomonas sp. PAMC 26621]|uniref:MarR family winged helix-turn-helix transcriptional regulator n=1 Tax=Sphingomonas sp. PAMC 26621 TaxID=1112213 RepID=UPI0002884636|nr:MarR family transcriptional regulator [Sphingomonas sp. PAMC 26621]